MRDLMSPIYHWTPQKIKVHMFFSHIAYLFLALIYNRAKERKRVGVSVLHHGYAKSGQAAVHNHR